jgi:hypothetical protein
LDPTFSQHLIARQSEIDDALRRLVSNVEARERGPDPHTRPSYRLNQGLSMLRLRNLRQKVQFIYGLDSEETRSRWALDPAADTVLSTALAQARTVVGSWGGTLDFVYLPSWDRYRNGPGAAEREHAKVLRLVNGLSIPVVDIGPAFQAQGDPLSLFPFRRFGHYNERGNRIVAATILKFLSGA